MLCRRHQREYAVTSARFFVLSLLFLLAAVCTRPTPLEREIESLDLKGGVIVYGTRGGAPSFLRLGGEPDEKYPLWSLSKPITAAVTERMAASDPALMQMQVRGASIVQLLQHTGGWDRAVTGDPISPDKDNCTNPPAEPRTSRPGVKQVYSNLGYCLIAQILSQHSGKSYVTLAHLYVPQTRTMDFDARLGAAGGWSGTALDYWRFAVEPLPVDALDRPAAVPAGPYYGYSWRVNGTALSHFGLMHARSFTLVAKHGDFAAVALFRTTPPDPHYARDKLVPLLLELQKRRGG